MTSQIRDVLVVLGQCTAVELAQFSFSAGCSMCGISGNEERFVFVPPVQTFYLRLFFIYSQCAIPQVKRGSEKDGVGTLFYLTTAVNQFPSVRLAYKTMTCNEQCACQICCVFASRSKTFAAPALKVARKSVILIAIHWTKTRGPRLTAHWNNAECCPGCCHAKRF